MKNLKNLSENQIVNKMTEIAESVLSLGHAETIEDAYKKVSSAYLRWTQGEFEVGEGSFISLDESIVKMLLRYNYEQSKVYEALHNVYDVFKALNNQSVTFKC